MRILITLLFISFNSFGQIQYKDVMRIDSKDAFLQLMFDNGFSSVEYEGQNDADITYLLNPIKDDDGEWLSSQLAQWWGRSDNFFFSFTRTNTNNNVVDNTYDEIYERVKRRDNFYKMYSSGKTTYACYVCHKGKFEGYLCFTINEGNGQIAQLRYID